MRTLYLIDLYGERYGIWKDEVASVRDVREVHHLPLSPASVAGIAVLEGRSTALVDLGACIGMRPAAAGMNSRALFVAGKRIDTGFLVPGEMRETEIPPEDVFAMPECVGSADVDTCVVIGHRPVPVINVVRTYDRIHERTAPSSTPAFLPVARNIGTVVPESVRLITVAGEDFAVPSASLRGEPVRPGAIARAAIAPRFIKGIAFHDGGILPVIDLAKRMELSVSGAGHLMLVTEVSGAAFGLIIDEDKGAAGKGEFSLKLLPPIAATGWAREAVLFRETVIPLIDPADVLSRRDRDESPAELPASYAPDSRIPEAFERQSVDVIEFSLLGVRHAIPKAEVEDVLSWRPCRSLPDALPIVIGVAVHNGEVLPVLDLALVFGRRSLETRDWSMVLVRNGDFRALVITEEVYGERTLPRDVQRKVPIVLPHNLVYGCYPEGIAVRLILNVEAIAVHFDRSVVQDLLPALTPEMAAAPAELVPSLLPEEHVRETAAPLAFETAGAKLELAAAGQAEAQTRVEERSGGVTEEKAGAEEKIRDAEEKSRSAAEEQAKQESEERANQEAAERARREEEAKARLEAEGRQRQETLARAVQEAEEKARQEAEARAEQEADERAQREAGERALFEAEEMKRRKAEEQALRTEEERKQALAEARNRQEAEERARREQEARAALEAEEKARRESEDRARREADEQERLRAEEAERIRREAEERARLESQERARAAEDSIREAEEIKRKKEAEPAFAGAKSYRDRTPSTFSPEPSAASRKPLSMGDAGWKKYAIAAAAGLVLVSLVYFGAQRGPAMKKIAEPSSVIIDEGKEPAGPPSGAETPKQQAGKKPVSGEALVLTVPKERAIESSVYAVRKGDTLWAICKRFTGNPLNYPRVARDNSIANPDLIFPGQKIYLKR